MKKIFTSLFAVSSVTFAVAPAQAVICPFGQVEYEGSCFPVEQPSGPSNSFTINAAGTVTHECDIENPGNLLLQPALDPNTGKESMRVISRFDFTQSSNTIWELSDLNVAAPSVGNAYMTITPPIGPGGRFGVGELNDGSTPRESVNVITGDGTFQLEASISTADLNLEPGQYSMSAVLSCYSSGGSIIGEN